MKKALLIMIAWAMAATAFAQNWTQLSSNSVSNLKGIHFPTASVGYAVGDNGTVLKTVNGGTNWTSLSTGLAGYWFWDVNFVNADTGWVVGESDPGSNPYGLGIVIKTVNGGSSWVTQLSGSTTPTRDLFVLNKDTLFICGGAEQTYSRTAKSFDGGANWTQIGTPELDAVVGGMFFLNASKGFMGQYIFTYLATWLSTVNGSTFTGSTIPSSGGYWNFASDFPDASHGYFTRSTYVGTDPVYLRKTTDGGLTWNEAVIPSLAASIYGLDFTDASTGYIVGAAGVIRKTTDGGASWNVQTSPTGQELRSVCFVNPSLGFAAGASGTILKYSVITGTAEKEAGEEPLSVYPNPASGILTIKAGPALSGKPYVISDLSGREVRSGTIDNARTLVGLSGLAAGVYVLRAGEGIERPVKIVKE